MSRFHISQDETEFWQLAYEDDSGQLTLVSHQFNGPDHLIHDAHEMVESGAFGQATVVVAPPRLEAQTEAAASPAADYKRPAPRRATD